MAEYTRKEFAAICHTTVGVINSNKARGNIIVNEEGYIDSENAINNSFFNKYSKYFEEKIKKTVVSENKPEKKEKRKKPPSKQNQTSQQIMDWDARKKQADAELQEYKAAHEKLKMEKLAGKLIPVDLVFQILNIHNRSIFTSFHSDAENLASVYCEILAEGDRKKLSEISNKLGYIISDKVEKSKELAEVELETAIEEYSETLNRGERK